MYNVVITLIALLSAVYTTLASPTLPLARRGLAGAYYTCTKPNFAGECSWTQPNTGCHIQGEPGGIKSLGPDPGTFCTLYSRDDCIGYLVQYVRFPGIAKDMPEFGSFDCSNLVGKREGDTATATVDANALVDGDVQGFGLLKTVESEGREEGMIGLKKGAYY